MICFKMSAHSNTYQWEKHFQSTAIAWLNCAEYLNWATQVSLHALQCKNEHRRNKIMFMLCIFIVLHTLKMPYGIYLINPFTTSMRSINIILSLSRWTQTSFHEAWTSQAPVWAVCIYHLIKGRLWWVSLVTQPLTSKARRLLDPHLKNLPDPLLIQLSHVPSSRATVLTLCGIQDLIEK